jgi:hypothetical protein
MDAVVAKFRTYREAEEATREYYRRLSPAERLEILFQLRAVAHKEVTHQGVAHKEDDATSGRLARVYRIAQLERG